MDDGINVAPNLNKLFLQTYLLIFHNNHSVFGQHAMLVFVMVNIKNDTLFFYNISYVMNF